jgi:hypothetical protein
MYGQPETWGVVANVEEAPDEDDDDCFLENMLCASILLDCLVGTLYDRNHEVHFKRYCCRTACRMTLVSLSSMNLSLIGS